ncbi:hypothetical protein L249_7781, partial [Ophiocordyceps polyrhachis-furcata BCC 54312]
MGVGVTGRVQLIFRQALKIKFPSQLTFPVFYYLAIDSQIVPGHRAEQPPGVPWKTTSSLMCYVTMVTGSISLVHHGVERLRGNEARLNFWPMGSRPVEDWWFPLPEGYMFRGPGIISMEDIVHHLEEGEEALAKSRLGLSPPKIETRLLPLHPNQCHHLDLATTPDFESAGDRMAKQLGEAKVEAVMARQGIQSTERGRVKSAAASEMFRWGNGGGIGEGGDALSPDGEGWSSNRWMHAGRSLKLRTIANVGLFAAGEIDSQTEWRSDGVWRRPGLPSRARPQGFLQRVDDGRSRAFQNRRERMYDDIPSGPTGC